MREQLGKSSRAIQTAQGASALSRLNSPARLATSQFILNHACFSKISSIPFSRKAGGIRCITAFRTNTNAG
jgi:hypothetical protein